MAIFESSVQYVKHCDVIFYVNTDRYTIETSNPVTGTFKKDFESKDRIVCEFFDPKTLGRITNMKETFDEEKGKFELRHEPIRLEYEGKRECIYVA